MTHEIYDIAIYYTRKNGGQIDLKKMQKMCYYSQAWSYAIRDKAICNATFEAWVHGPVNRKLWETFKDISYRDISLKDFEEKRIVTEELSEEEHKFLNRVWATYGKCSGYQLEMISHQEKPWVEKREGLGKFEAGNRIISETTMKDFYRSLMIQGANN